MEADAGRFNLRHHRRWDPLNPTPIQGFVTGHPEHLLLQRGLHGLIDALQALLVQFDVDAQIELAAELFIQLVEQLLAAVEQIVEIIV